MTKLAIDSAFFTDHADVMRDIAKTGYWPTTYVSNQSPELPVHHHDYNIIGYVLSGSGYLLDEQAQRVEIKAGDRLRIPKRGRPRGRRRHDANGLHRYSR